MKCLWSLSALHLLFTSYSAHSFINANPHTMKQHSMHQEMDGNAHRADPLHVHLSHDSVQARAAEIADTPIVHAIGGAFGSVLSLVLLYPLDRIRVEMQSRVASPINQSSRELPNVLQTRNLRHNRSSFDSVKDKKGESLLNSNKTVGGGEDICQDKAMREDTKSSRYGVLKCLSDLSERGELYRGILPVMLSMSLSNFIFFYAHEAVKNIIFSNQAKNTAKGAGKALLASTLAGVVNVLVTNPLWVATLRIQIGSNNSENVNNENSRQRKSSLFSIIRKIVHEEGLLKLWSGTAASLVLCSNPAIQISLYERLKRNILDARKVKKGDIGASLSLGMLDAFLIGALSKAFATIATYPLQLAQVLIRLQHDDHSHDDKEEKQHQGKLIVQREKYSGSIDCLRKLWKRGGILAWYSGIDAKLLQTVLTAAFTFLSYEQVLSAVKRAIIIVYTVQAKRNGKSY